MTLEYFLGQSLATLTLYASAQDHLIGIPDIYSSSHLLSTHHSRRPTSKDHVTLIGPSTLDGSRAHDSIEELREASSTVEDEQDERKTSFELTLHVSELQNVWSSRKGEQLSSERP